MSLRYEQYYALLKTRVFLRSILSTKKMFTAKELREKAYNCLRHYPFLHENGQPIFSKDEFTVDEE